MFVINEKAHFFSSKVNKTKHVCKNITRNKLGPTKCPKMSYKVTKRFAGNARNG